MEIQILILVEILINTNTNFDIRPQYRPEGIFFVRPGAVHQLLIFYWVRDCLH